MGRDAQELYVINLSEGIVQADLVTMDIGSTPVGRSDLRPRVRLVGVSGSLRAGSYNTALLRAVAEACPADVVLDLVDIGDLPLFNEDLVPDLPASVARIQAAVRSADGLVIAGPEYNGGVSGPLKNALDWLSVPRSDGLLRGMPVAVIGASTGMLGSARSQVQLRSILAICGSELLAEPEVLLPFAHQAFDEDLRPLDDRLVRRLERLVCRLADDASRVRPAR